MKLFFYSLSYTAKGTLGASCHLGPMIFYFSTQRKLDLWRKKNPSIEKDTVFNMHEIDLATCKDLIRISKKKPKCYECGR